jgi:hypothetical protein
MMKRKMDGAGQASGEQAGTFKCSGFGYEGESPTLTGTRCASVHGFTLHANPHIAAHRRDQLERLIRYSARGAVSLERLEQDAQGELIYTFTKPWSDGPSGINLSPLELLEKLAALVPPPCPHCDPSASNWSAGGRSGHRQSRSEGHYGADPS